MIDADRNCYSYLLEESKIESWEYVIDTVYETKQLENPPIFMLPIYQTFVKRSSSENVN